MSETVTFNLKLTATVIPSKYDSCSITVSLGEPQIVNTWYEAPVAPIEPITVTLVHQYSSDWSQFVPNNKVRPSVNWKKEGF